MLLRKVDGESEEFAGLRDSLWRLCEIMEEKNVLPIRPFFNKKRLFSENLVKACHITVKGATQGALPTTKKRKINDKGKEGKNPSLDETVS